MKNSKFLPSNLCILITSKEEEEAVLKEFERRNVTWCDVKATQFKPSNSFTSYFPYLLDYGLDEDAEVKILSFQLNSTGKYTHTASSFLLEYGAGNLYAKGVWATIVEQKPAEDRYFVDLRSGCGAVIDRKHPSYDPTYHGLNDSTHGVIVYRHGFQNSEKNCWDMKKEDVDYLQSYCAELNKSEEVKEIETEDIIDMHNRPFIVASARELIQANFDEKISFSRLVEILNQMAVKWHKSQPVSKYPHPESEVLGLIELKPIETEEQTLISKINWDKVSFNPTIIDLIKQREKIEDKIRSIEPDALINFELEMIQISPE